MIKNNNFYRSFIMLEADKNSISSKKATGYLKIEMREKKIKIVIHIQNIDYEPEKNTIKVYLMSKMNKKMAPYCLGEIRVNGNHNGDEVFNLKRAVLEKQEINIEEYDTVVLLKTYLSKNDTTNITFPLIGFKDGDWDWKTCLLDILNKKNSEKLKDEIKKNEEPEQKDNSPYDKEENTNLGDDIKEINDTQELSKESQIKSIKKEKFEENNIQIPLEDKSQINNSNENQINITEEKSIDNMYLNTNNKNLENMLDKIQNNSEEITIFENTYPMSKCYKTFDLTFITDDLFDCYSNLSFAYNYDMNAAFYKYGHYILGIEEDNNNITHLYFGIPSKFGTEPHPFLYVQQYSTWIPASDGKYEIGELGYWLIKIDALTGDLKEFNK